ncbi:MAG: hypothetical protein ABSB32_10860 [Thermodesulfobacteriota bacterium]
MNQRHNIEEKDNLCRCRPSNWPPIALRWQGGSVREADESRHGGTGEDLPGGPNLVSPKRWQVRKMAKNHTSKSALAKEGSVLDDSAAA